MGGPVVEGGEGAADVEVAQAGEPAALFGLEGFDVEAHGFDEEQFAEA